MNIGDMQIERSLSFRLCILDLPNGRLPHFRAAVLGS
jgi:hypothetical protein